MPVLFGTDFTPGATPAGLVAAAVSRRLGERLVLLHVGEGEHVAALEREVERLRRPGLELAAEALPGRPHEVLVERARQLQAQLIVVGATGEDSSWLVGSVAERTAQRSPVPVLVVRQAEALEAWEGGGEEPLRVVVATDFSRSCEGALQWAAEFCRHGACRLTYAYVARPPEEFIHPADHELVLRRLRARVGEATAGAEFHVSASWGRPADVLLQLPQVKEAHLVVVGTKQAGRLRRFWEGSVSRRLIGLAEANVVCAPMPATPPPAPVARPRRVLVATDLSPDGNLAVPAAFAIVAEGGTVHVLHVVNELSPSEPAARLESAVPDTASAQARVELVQGVDPAEEICRSAVYLQADLVCLAYRRHSWSRTVFGSVDQRVLTDCPVPVLLVATAPSIWSV